jgi:predicted GNAT family N-acyltransferase
VNLVVAAPGLAPVYEPTTEQELEELWTFRDSVFVDEFARKLVDAEGRVHDEDDDRPSTLHLYTRDEEGISGAIRLVPWPPGEIPRHDFDKFSLELFPGIEQLTTCELGRVMIRPAQRGSLLLVALVGAAYELGVDRLDVEIAFLTCFPALLHLYRRLGARPYAGRLVKTPDAAVVPMAIVPSDLEVLERERSFLLPLAQRRFGEGGRPRLDVTPYTHLFEAERAPLTPDALPELERLRQEPSQGGFLAELSESTLQTLSREGLLLSLSGGDVLTDKGLGQRELFVIVDGVFEVVDGEQRLRLLSAGDVVGEIAFFSTAGRRTATVRAVSTGRVVVLRRRFVDRLRRRDPAAAAEILFALGRVQADRAAAAF